MGCFAGPKIVNDNLVLDLDAANIKSYQYYPTTTDHGISEWYCFVSGTATYSIITANVSIYQENQGVITTVVSGTTNPQRGTISIIAGCTYYGNGPIFLMVEDQQHSIAPISMAGTKFANYTIRLNPGLIYIYSPYTSSNVSFYDATASGVNSTPTSSFSLGKGEVEIIPLPNLGWSYISATNPVLCTTTQTGADKKILTPASTHVYNRITQFNNTITNTTPSTVGSYYVTDTTNLVVSDQIADGSGGDTNQGLGYQHLCDRYSWGNSLSDYQIVAPYSTTVTVSYWNGSSWTVWDTHVLSGTQSSPVYVARDGTNGAGVAATIISGAAAYMASGSTGPWKWEGTNPFYLCINDTSDDEYSMLGWLNSKTAQVSTDFCLGDISSTGQIAQSYNDISYSTNNNGILVLDGSNDYANTASTTFDLSAGVSLEVVFKSTDLSSRAQGIMTLNSTAGRYINFYMPGNGTLRWETWNPASTIGGAFFSSALSNNTWYHVIGTYKNDGTAVLYINGAVTNSATYTSSSYSSSYVTTCILGSYAGYLSGNISLAKVYNKTLTQEEVLQNFNALRGRYGL